MNRKVLNNLSYGVYVVTTKDGDKNVGCIANSIMQVTSKPDLLAVSINHDNHTNKSIKMTKAFGVSILKETSDLKIIGEFGFKSSKDTDKFKNVDYKELKGIPVISDSCGYMICKVTDVVETNTHTLFLAAVLETDGVTDDNPMTYKYYQEKLKGSSSKNAPTYDAENQLNNPVKNTKRWKCKVCGYVYEGEKLPPTFTCPICGQPHRAFYEID